MNKYIYILLILSLTKSAVSQSFKPDNLAEKKGSKDNPASLDTSFATTNSKSGMYSSMMAYLSKTNSDTRNIIESKDLELGEISFSAFQPILFKSPFKNTMGETVEIPSRVDVFYKCKVYLKDKKSKIVFHSLEYQPYVLDKRLNVKFNINADPGTGNLMEEAECKKFLLLTLKGIVETLKLKPENDF